MSTPRAPALRLPFTGAGGLSDWLGRNASRLLADHGRRLGRPAPFDLASRLVPLGDVVAKRSGAYESLSLDPRLVVGGEGTWAPGYYALVVHVVPPGERAFAKLYVDSGDGYREDEAFGLVVRADKPVFRIVRLDRPARRLRFDPLEEAGAFELRALHLLRVPEAFGRRRMLARLASHHPTFAGRALADVITIVRGRAVEQRLAFDALLYRLYGETFQPSRRRADYAAWRALVEAPGEAKLDVEATTIIAALPKRPRISVLVPTYETDPAHLAACLESVLAQSYPHLELCVADDASKSPHVRATLERFAARDPRVRVTYRAENGHIARASNDALALATGELVALVDHDDLLPRHALLRVAMAFDARPETVFLYGDEDKLGPDGLRKNPHFKPEWNPDLVLAQSYVGHLLVARTDHVRAIGGFREGYEGSQDHDLVLRLTETLDPGAITHVPHVLYHWRESETSTARASSAKAYTADAGLRAVRDALARRGTGAEVELAPDVPNAYRVRWPLPDDLPLVSLVVPTRDAVDLLRISIPSLLEKTTYPRLELLLVDNGSRAPETHAFFDSLEGDPRVRIFRDDRPFNFSALNNAAVAEARGELVALVNNDIEVIDGAWLTEMVRQAVRPEIGCVGAKLLYPDGRIQHGGVIVGLGGVAGHAHKYFDKDHPGYFHRLRLAHALSAVTAACLVVEKRIYDEVGGLDESLAVAFNDVDFCLRVREAGYRNLFTPYATLVHHESATRGPETTPEKRTRFALEIETMKARWGRRLTEDPYYSPNLSLDHEDFSIGLRV